MSLIKKIAILGVGFMGGSLALGLRKIFPKARIYGYARSRSSYEKLSRLNILSGVEQDLRKVIENSDIVVLAFPVYVIVDYFKRISPFLKKGAIVFDVGSSKALIEKSARRYLPKNVYFIGCHPLCGSDKSGAEFSKTDLYKDALCLITSSPSNNAIKVVKDIWERLGSKVVFVSASRHDKILSSISHLNHIISFSITNSILDSYLNFASPSLKDMTRISNSPSFVWADIFLSNKKNILKDIKRFTRILRKFEKLIAQGKKEQIIKLIEKANKKQKSLTNQQ
ncbi:MAG: prephenate dehydrogenase [Candidatus Omnitrophota bacterium]|nr:prephenate dehydrogenase [Candidatus Omnitrophota bacterium]